MIERLTLSDFRNHRDALIVPDSRFIVLTGENGAGKTNILEAVSLLTPGRGLRGAPLSHMARQDGPGFFGVAAAVNGHMIGTGTAPEAPDRRKVRINGAAQAATALADHMALIWLTPAMDRLFTEPASGRRRFLDRLTLALHPGHAVHANRYEAAMRARNRLLVQDGHPDPHWLDALEQQMQDHGEAMEAARADMVERLETVLESEAEGPFARPTLAIARATENDGGLPLRERLRQGRRRDAAVGRTLAGPHRDDLEVRHRAKQQAAALCSTGEQKAMLLSLLLAHARLVSAWRGQPPVLLLDEVAAHLDPLRRGALFERLADMGGQSWMTGTEAALFDGIGSACRLRVRDGAIFQDC